MQTFKKVLQYLYQWRINILKKVSICRFVDLKLKLYCLFLYICIGKIHLNKWQKSNLCTNWNCLWSMNMCWNRSCGCWWWGWSSCKSSSSSSSHWSPNPPPSGVEMKSSSNCIEKRHSCQHIYFLYEELQWAICIDWKRALSVINEWVLLKNIPESETAKMCFDEERLNSQN